MCCPNIVQSLPSCHQLLLLVQGNDANKAIRWLALAGDCYLDRFAVRAEQFVMCKVPQLTKHAQAEMLQTRYVPYGVALVEWVRTASNWRPIREAELHLMSSWAP